MEQSTLAIVIILITIISFIVAKIPLAMTSLLSALAMAIFGVISYSDALSGFGSSTVMMVTGMIIVGNALFETGLAHTIASIILKNVQSNEKKFLFVILILASLLSAFTSNTAVVALFLPIISTVSKYSNGIIKVKNSAMPLSVAAVLGGTCTIVGSTPQLVVQGILTQTEGVETLQFFELAKIGVPMVIIMIVFYLTIGYNMQKKIFDFTDISEYDETLSEEVAISSTEHNKIKMWISGLVLCGCVVAFIFELWDVGIIAMLGAVILIITGCISEKRAYETMDWSTIVIVAGAIGFSKGLESSGAGQLIADSALNLLGGDTSSPIIVMAVIVLISVVLTNFMSNTAAASMMTPISIYLAKSLGINPIAFVVAVVISCNLAFATPVGTAPVTLTLSAGYRFSDYTLVGGPLTIILTLATIILIPIVYGISL